MDYLVASNRFNFRDFINQIKDLDHLSISIKTSQEINVIENTNIPKKTDYKKEIDYLKRKYLSELRDFSSILNQGIRYNNIDEDNLELVRQVIVGLVKKGMLKNSILKIFE